MSKNDTPQSEQRDIVSKPVAGKPPKQLKKPKRKTMKLVGNVQQKTKGRINKKRSDSLDDDDSEFCPSKFIVENFSKMSDKVDVPPENEVPKEICIEERKEHNNDDTSTVKPKGKTINALMRIKPKPCKKK